MPVGTQPLWLSELYVASVSNRIANGPNAGQRAVPAGDRVDPEGIEERPPSLCAGAGGFNLHAAVVIPANDRDRLERLLRYAARPPFATERLEQLPDGGLAYHFKTPWRDGTSRVLLTPLEFIERLAALVPTPRAHLIRFSGVLGPAAKWRSQIVPAGAEASASIPSPTVPVDPVTSGSSAPSASEQSAAEAPGKNRGRRNHSWAQLIQRVFSVDVTTCERCGGKLRLISTVHPPEATRKILDHLGLPSRPPPLTPAERAANRAFTLDA